MVIYFVKPIAQIGFLYLYPTVKNVVNGLEYVIHVFMHVLTLNSLRDVEKSDTNLYNKNLTHIYNFRFILFLIMILGIGVDIVHLPRIASLITRRGSQGLAKRILSSREQKEFERFTDERQQLVYLGSRYL